MRNSARLRVSAAVLLVGFGSSHAAAQIAPRGSGFQAEHLAELQVAEDHLVRLAEALPEQLYTCRPAAGVRSVSEVLLHVAGSNLNLPRVLGITPGQGMVGAEYDRSTTAKSEVVAALRGRFVISARRSRRRLRLMPRSGFRGSTARPRIEASSISWPVIPGSTPVS